MAKEFFQTEPAIFTSGGGEPGLEMDTLRNFQHAIAHGSDVTHTHVSLTGDNRVVLHSDMIYHSPAIGSRGVEFRSRAELQELFSGYGGSTGDTAALDEGELFPELDWVLGRLPERRFHFLLNGSRLLLADAFIESVASRNASHRVLVSAGGGIMKRIRRSMPDIATTFTFGEMLGFYALFKTGLAALRRTFPADALIIPEKIGVSFIANPGLIHEARMRGIRVYLFDVESEAAVRRNLESGADGFVTGNAPLIRRIIG